jgi:hypothetical protein
MVVRYGDWVDEHFLSLFFAFLRAFVVIRQPILWCFLDACVLVGGHDLGVAAIFPIKSPAVIRRKPACKYSFVSGPTTRL